MNPQFTLRPMRDSDRAYVLHSWRTTFDGAPAVRGADRDHYWEEMGRVIARLLKTATTLVACDRDDDDTIVGWIAFTDHEFHYGVIKDIFRSDLKLADLLKGIEISKFTFRCRRLEHGLVGVDGCEFRKRDDGFATWIPPKGWRYTPRFTL